MTTSGVTTWPLTAGQLCRQAALELGVLESGGELSPEELDDCIVRLNGMIKSWSTKANLFRETTGTVTLPPDTASGTLPQGVRDISAARLVISATNERPLSPWNRAQYYAFPNRGASGSPTVYYFEKGISGTTLFVWPVPTVSTDIKIDYSRTAETVTDASETVDLPEEWQETILKGLATRIANMFGSLRTDPATVQKVAAEAAVLEQQMFDLDRPDSYFLEPYNEFYG
jgi:hypothetical protein